MEESFHTTLEAARQGTEWAWVTLYRDHAPSVLRYLRARGARDPEELLGAVFLDVVRSLGRFEGGYREFRAWVYTIAQRRLIDERRRAGRRLDEPAAPDSLAEAPASGDAEHDALQALSRSEICRTLSCLTDTQRDVLLLRVLAGLSIAETARVVGKREGAVKALQSRALQALELRLARPAVSSPAPPTIPESE